MKRIDYLNPEEVTPITPAEESLYDGVMNIIRVEVRKASADFETITDTPEHRQALKDVITKAIQVALIEYIKGRNQDPTLPLPRPTDGFTPEQLQILIDSMRRINEQNEHPSPIWPGWDRTDQYPLGPRPNTNEWPSPYDDRIIYNNGPTYFTTDGTGGTYFTDTNTYTTSTTIGGGAGFGGTGSSVAVDYTNSSNTTRPNRISRNVIDEIYTQAFLEIMTNEKK